MSSAEQFVCGTTGLINGSKKFYVGPTESSYLEARKKGYKDCQSYTATHCEIISCYDVNESVLHTCDSIGEVGGFIRFYVGETKLSIDSAAKDAYTTCHMNANNCKVTDCR